MVQEDCLDSEVLRKVGRKRPHSPYFSRVMPAEVEIDPTFGGIEIVVVRCFTRDEGVQARRARGIDLAACPARDDPDAPYPFRSARDHPHTAAEYLIEPRGQGFSPHFQLSPEPHLDPSDIPERSLDPDTQRSREANVVADNRMNVQGQMRRIHTDVRSHESSDAVVRSSGQGLQPVPEEAMVDHQEVGPLVDGRVDGDLGRVHGQSDLPDFTLSGELKAVEGVSMVRDFARPEISIEVFGEPVGGDHEGGMLSPLCVGNSCGKPPPPVVDNS
jgi:hypothetical protein